MTCLASASAIYISGFGLSEQVFSYFFSAILSACFAEAWACSCFPGLGQPDYCLRIDKCCDQSDLFDSLAPVGKK
ncbi:MAG: hypothetical protein C4519_10900 [Desulfobacteraceae bacterium]|nr:MAG: hypothetical protein C4519_10900 [Desulfobacteraceae bacterium]